MYISKYYDDYIDSVFAHSLVFFKDDSRGRPGLPIGKKLFKKLVRMKRSLYFCRPEKRGK
jgi:hypothetical protein